MQQNRNGTLVIVSGLPGEVQFIMHRGDVRDNPPRKLYGVQAYDPKRLELHRQIMEILYDRSEDAEKQEKE